MKTIQIYDNDYEYIQRYLKRFFEDGEEITSVDIAEAVEAIFWEHDLHASEA